MIPILIAVACVASFYYGNLDWGFFLIGAVFYGLFITPWYRHRARRFFELTSQGKHAKLPFSRRRGILLGTVCILAGSPVWVFIQKVFVLAGFGLGLFIAILGTFGIVGGALIIIASLQNRQPTDETL